jgi:cell division protein FtsL
MAVARPARSARARPVSAKQTKRHLRVIRGGSESISVDPRPRVAGARFIVVVVLVLAALVYGLVLMHMMLAQSSFELQEARQHVAEEEARYRRMRYEVARETSPAKIADAARELGMVVPKEQRYLVDPREEAPAGRSDESSTGRIKAVMGTP